MASKWNPFKANENTIENAESELIGKMSKMQTALESVFVNDLHHLSKDQRAAANAYTNRKVFGGDRVTGDSEGEMIVADDVQVVRGAGAAAIAAIAIPAALAVGALAYNAIKEPPVASAEKPAPASLDDTDTRYTVQPLPGE